MAERIQAVKDIKENYKTVHDTAVASLGGARNLAHTPPPPALWFRGGGLILKVLMAQLGFATVAALACWAAAGDVWAYSAMLGGLAAVVPNAFLGLRLMLPRPKTGEKTLLRAAYMGELGKLLLMVAMCCVIFSTVRPLAGAAFFIGFIVAQFAALSGLFMNSGYPKYLMDQNYGK